MVLLYHKEFTLEYTGMCVIVCVCVCVCDVCRDVRGYLLTSMNLKAKFMPRVNLLGYEHIKQPFLFALRNCDILGIRTFIMLYWLHKAQYT